MWSISASGRSVVGIAAVAVLATGCSSGTSATTAGRPGSGADAGSTAAGPAKVTCNQLGNADVAALMTNPVTGDDVTTVGTDGDGQQCVFHDADSEQAVDVIVVPAADPAVGWDVAKAHATNPVTVSGVGDEAFRDGGDDGLTARHAGVLCTVSLGTDSQLPGATALTTNGSLTFTEAQNTVVAQALGTVCNRLFGTGNTTADLSGLK